MQRNQHKLEDLVSLDLLQSHEAGLVIKTPFKFVLKTQNSSEQHYPPATSLN